MKRRLVLNPLGWPCTLADCPPGPFIVPDHSDDTNLCFKSEYHSNSGSSEAYNSAGERFCTGDETIVQPLEALWEEYDE